MKTTIAALLLLILVPGICNAGALKDEYELKKKCGVEAGEYFVSIHGNGQPTKDNNNNTSGYTNHYNKKLNACYILTWSSNGKDNSKMLEDVHENAMIGLMSYEANSAGNTYYCNVGEKQCSTIKEFDKLIKPYMTQ